MFDRVVQPTIAQPTLQPCR